MDKSETFIKMSEKAEEIQALKPESAYEDKEFWHIADDGDLTWLPRQDQLQEMVEDGASSRFAHDFVYHFWQFVNHELAAVARCSSMEQLWLAFVMEKRYNKVWANNEWRNGSE